MSGSGFSSSLAEPVRDAFAVLRGSAEAERLAHGYVVSCDRMEWGTAFATLFLQWLFCREAQRPCGQCRACRQVEARTHPDTVWIEPANKSRQIDADQIRAQVNPLIQQTSFEGGWKAAVLLDADRITEAAANAFLKTLEEPPALSLMLLVTMNPGGLLPTILSRCQRIHIGDARSGASFSRVEAAMLDWLRRRTRKDSALVQAGWIAAILAEVRAQAEAAEKETAGEEGIDKEILEARIQARVVEARLQIVRLIYRWERDLLVLAGGGDKKTLQFPDEWATLARQSEGLTVAACLRRLARVDEAVRLLDRNIPENVVWETALPV